MKTTCWFEVTIRIINYTRFLWEFYCVVSSAVDEKVLNTLTTAGALSNRFHLNFPYGPVDEVGGKHLVRKCRHPECGRSEDWRANVVHGVLHENTNDLHARTDLVFFTLSLANYCILLTYDWYNRQGSSIYYLLIKTIRFFVT